ncbi:transglutaminase family protein [Leeuwenhoekiella sp. A16]|uniref:transglutaminase-like domain-containing protein n=1 Tax=unclassified Leeuwenhoekiella TaxID=2615029 RepID=UPI003A80925B
MKYTIKYKAHNTYETPVDEALWQFLIIPENNDSQELVREDFTNSLRVAIESSINGYGFNTYRIHPKKQFKDIHFDATFVVKKSKPEELKIAQKEAKIDIYSVLHSLEFKSENEPFLRTTPLTQLPENPTDIFSFDITVSPFANLQALNKWIFDEFTFKPNVTTIESSLGDILETKEGVCQDFTHLFCAIARKNNIPTRYVSGYLHRGIGYLGDSQMHAWVECLLPEVGWVGFDPTNNLFAEIHHIKVCHGKDYTDCSPLKGIIFTTGANETSYSVEVTSPEDDEKILSQTQQMGDMVQTQSVDTISQIQQQQQQTKKL